MVGHTILLIFDGIALLLLTIFLFVQKDTLSGDIVRLVSCTIVVITNVLQIPYDIKNDNNYVLTIIIIILFLLDIINYSIKIGKKSKQIMFENILDTLDKLNEIDSKHNED